MCVCVCVCVCVCACAHKHLVPRRSIKTKMYIISSLGALCLLWCVKYDIWFIFLLRLVS